MLFVAASGGQGFDRALGGSACNWQGLSFDKEFFKKIKIKNCKSNIIFRHSSLRLLCKAFKALVTKPVVFSIAALRPT